MLQTMIETMAINTVAMFIFRRTYEAIVFQVIIAPFLLLLKKIFRWFGRQVEAQILEHIKARHPVRDPRLCIDGGCDIVPPPPVKTD